MPNKHQCPCCSCPVELAEQQTKRGILHMATCMNEECPLNGYTLTIEGYSNLRWELYIKDAAKLKEVLRKVEALGTAV